MQIIEAVLRKLFPTKRLRATDLRPGNVIVESRRYYTVSGIEKPSTPLLVSGPFGTKSAVTLVLSGGERRDIYPAARFAVLRNTLIEEQFTRARVRQAVSLDARLLG